MKVLPDAQKHPVFFAQKIRACEISAQSEVSCSQKFRAHLPSQSKKNAAQTFVRAAFLTLNVNKLLDISINRKRRVFRGFLFYSFEDDISKEDKCKNPCDNRNFFCFLSSAFCDNVRNDTERYTLCN